MKQLELDYPAHNFTDTSKSAWANKKDKLTKREQVYEYVKTQDIENPHKYDMGTTQMIFSFIMTKPYKPQPNVDGMKPIAQAIPQPMQQVAKAEESFDDDLPPF